MMWQTVKEYHRLLPKTKVRSWVANLTSFLQGASADGRLPVGSGCLGCVIGFPMVAAFGLLITCVCFLSGCSGTDVWLHCLHALLAHWAAEFGLPSCVVEHKFAAECETAKQAFLKQEFPTMGMLVQDVMEFTGPRVMNVLTNSSEFLPWVQVYGGGFSCKGNSKQNSKRKENKGCIRRLEGSSGTTFEAMRAYIVKSRPKVFFLENVPDVQQSVEQTDGTSASDAEYVKEVFQKEGFFVLTVEFSCRSYGSPAERRRWWVVGFDIPADKRDGVEQSFHETFESFRMDPYPVEKILLSEEFIASVDHSFGVKSHKKNKGDVLWKTVHEAAYADMDVAWPPDISALWMFRDREAEVVFLANHLFPCKELGMWSFFDSNHCLERSLKWPAQGDHGLRNPWKEYIPTMTAGSVIACRRVNEDSSITLKKLHGLESFRAIGWDLGHWNGNPFQHEEVTSDLLNDMAGNAWSSWAFMPIAISAFGAAPWSKYRKDEEGVGSASSASASDSEASSV